MSKALGFDSLSNPLSERPQAQNKRQALGLNPD